ncbi:MAG: MFS transporter [Candidatus Hydrogenedentes bacterium]|nr:MFS transporter [Candidatus Hydrogenedentota bacterium]
MSTHSTDDDFPRFTPANTSPFIPHLRWWIGGLLFAVTIINYIDRQTLSVLAPILKKEYTWSNERFAIILISFRVAYTVMQTVFGRILDAIGTRRGMAISVAFYSVIAGLTSLAQGLFSFSVFRALLATGESANNPGGSKVVSEWFPAKERAWAVALFDSGSSIGGAVAPFIVLFIYEWFDSWRPVFLITSTLGFFWLLAWLLLYRLPHRHPRLSPQELAYIQAGQTTPTSDGDVHAKLRWSEWFKLLTYRQTWGIVLGRSLLDPYWFLIAEWYGIYLNSKGFSLEQSMLGFWAPFLGADLGNFFGGGLSSYWIKRGWPVGKARRAVLTIFGPSMLLLIPAAFNDNYYVLLFLFAYASFAYAACSTMFLTLPTDVFHSRAVGSVMGLGGTGAGIGVLFSTWLIGRISDQYSFQPIIIAASIIPCIATAVFVTMVRARNTPDPEGVVLDF